jgi:hypothetical protein
MGDASHQNRRSDHNQGNAIDVTVNAPDSPDGNQVADGFRRQMRANPNGRITYLIHQRRIASPQSSWEWRPYNGPNPHSSHVHISIRASERGNVRPWSLPPA